MHTVHLCLLEVNKMTRDEQHYAKSFSHFSKTSSCLCN